MIKLARYSMGATSAIVTSMGLIAGLAHGGDSKTSIIAGLLIIAVVDNISDSLGIHIYKESEGASVQEIKLSTLGNFFIRLILTLTFVLIVYMFPPNAALMIASAWGLTLLTILSYMISKVKMTSPVREMAYHLTVAVMVILGCKLMGNFISTQVAG
jgi:hypothetical protein